MGTLSLQAKKDSEMEEMEFENARLMGEKRSLRGFWRRTGGGMRLRWLTMTR